MGVDNGNMEWLDGQREEGEGRGEGSFVQKRVTEKKKEEMSSPVTPRERSYYPLGEYSLSQEERKEGENPSA